MVTNFKKNKRGDVHTLMLHLGGVLLLVIFVVLIVADIHMYQKKQAFLAEVQSLKNQIQQTEQQNTQLNQNISQANNDQYIQKVAREQLDLQEPGETAVSFVMPPVPDQKPVSQKSDAMHSWLGWIGGGFTWMKNNF